MNRTPRQCNLGFENRRQYISREFCQVVYNLGGVGWDVKHEIAIPNPFSTKTDDMIPSLLKFDAGASTALMIESVAHC